MTLQRVVKSNLKRNLLALTFAKRSQILYYLKIYGINLENGEYRCMVCGDRIKQDNIGILIVKGKRISFVCNKKTCMDRANILASFNDNLLKF